MKTAFRLHAITLASSFLPVLVFAVFVSVFGTGYAYALAAAAAAAAAFVAARAILTGLALPMGKAAAGIKGFTSNNYKLESVIKKDGWPETGNLISNLNRLLLELNAYRAFHLNQVVEDRAKAQALIETITDGVLLLDDRGQLIYSNQKALNLLGVPKQEADITLPGSVRQKAFLSVLTEIMASQENNLKAEVEIEDTTGTCSIVKNFQVLARHFFLATLRKPGRIVVLRDVTIEKGIERAKETLFHMITHDMRAPLASIQGYVQLLKTTPGSPQTDKYLEVISRSSIRLKGMIEDILNTIKLERGDMALDSVTINAADLCARVHEQNLPLAARKQIKLSFSPPHGKTELTCDAALLDRVISNLVANALKFTLEEGEVSIACARSSGNIMFSVQDTGPGIPKDKQAEVFKKYAQLEEHKMMGFGLGLAMCKMAVELHKGRIWVESEEGKGSKFIFTIPAGPAENFAAAGQNDAAGK